MTRAESNRFNYNLGKEEKSKGYESITRDYYREGKCISGLYYILGFEGVEVTNFSMNLKELKKMSEWQK